MTENRHQRLEIYDARNRFYNRWFLWTEHGKYTLVRLTAQLVENYWQLQLSWLHMD